MGSGVIYREITVKSALTRVQGMPFAWSLNPYYGCERACVYCYARDYHARRGRDTGAGFDREIDVKINFPELLTQELRRIRKRETVALGTATDPYQQCEGRYRITRRTLEALVASPPLKPDPSVKPHSFAFPSENFPALLPSTETRFAERVNPERIYTDALEERARRARSRYHFEERPFRRPEPTTPSQMRLAI